MRYKSLNYLIDAKALTVTTTDGESLNIRPKTCQFLLVLLSNAGVPVNKQTLLDQVWPESVVEEQVVFQSVKELRQLFLGNEVIKTIPKQGYVWLPAVEFNSPTTNTIANTERLSNRSKFIAMIAIALFALLLAQYMMKMYSNNGPLPSQVQSNENRVAGSVIILPTTNQIQGNDHSWVRLGLMDQLIQRLPNNSQHGVLQTDYVLEVLERASAPLSHVEPQHIPQIFLVSGADLIISTKLSGTPHDYQLSYTFYRKGYKKQGVLFSNNTQDLVDELSILLAKLLGNKNPLSAEQYHADFNHQMLGVAIDFRLEGNHKAALPLLTSIVEKDAKNFTAQRLLVGTMFALKMYPQAGNRLAKILPIAQKHADNNELVRLMYFQAINLLMTKDDSAAIVVIKSAFDIAKENSDWLYQAYLSDLQARIAIDQEDFAKAETLFYQSMKFHQVLKCPVGETASWINLALLAKQQSQDKKQKEAFDKASAIAQKRDLTRQTAYIKELTK